MSDLQLVLLAVGAVIILLVVLFNWWQERKYKQRAAAAFASYQQDVLLDPALTPVENLPTLDDAVDPMLREEPVESPVQERRIRETSIPAAPPAERREPVLGKPRMDAGFQSNVEAPIAPPPKTAREVLTYPSQQDERVDLLVDALSHDPLDVDLIRSLHRQLHRLEKRVSWQALMEDGQWFPLDPDANLPIVGLRIGLQMADRRGPLDEPTLRQFVAGLETFSAETGVELRLPSLAQALADAQKLDNFCADVDVTIGLNLIADDSPFGLIDLRRVLERAGLRLMADGAYHMVNEKGQHLFTLVNFDNNPFPPHPAPRDSTEGVTFLFDVPRVADGLTTFGQMSDLAKQVTSQLGGRLVDDNRKLLTDSGLASIRQQLRAIYGTMSLKGVEPGAATALRLFA